MLRIISIPLSAIVYFLFFFFICLFHPIQALCLRVFGYQAHKRSVDVLNFFLLYSLWAVFTTARVEFRGEVPTDKPLIFVANHQGLFDIIGMAWLLHKYHLNYVSKIELGKGIPSVSYNLRHGGSALIDRKDPKQALPALKKLGEYIQTTNRAAVIYPEGTRSRDGRPGRFSSNGLKILCKYAPDALIVPVSINNSWKIFRYGKFPLGLGNRLQFIVHPPLPVKGTDFNPLFEATEAAVVNGLDVPRKS